MSYEGKAYKRVAVAQTKKEEVDDESSGYGYTTGRNSRALNDFGSVVLPSPTRENSVSSRNYYREINVCNQTRKNDTDKSNGTEICIGCLLKGGEKKQATHFCKTCDTYGRYICYCCMVDHNIWTGKNHDVVSLSVERGTDSVWQLEERHVRPGKTDYHDIDSWFKQAVPEDDSEYGVLNDGDMASLDVTRNSNVSDYTWANSFSDAMATEISLPDVNQNSDEDGYADYKTIEKEEKRLRIKEPYNNFECVSERDYIWANSDSDVMQRPRMPLPDTYQRLKHNVDGKTYEEYRTVEGETKKMMINEQNDISGRGPGRRSGALVVDGFRQPYVTYDNTEVDYTLADLYNETQDNVKHNPLRAKEFRSYGADTKSRRTQRPDDGCTKTIHISFCGRRY